MIAGPVSLDLYLRSSARDTDLQVTLSEVRPDGNETYVQNGWLRASHRRLDPARSTPLDPVPTHQARDASLLPKGRFVLVRVPIFPVATHDTDWVLLPGGQLDRATAALREAGFEVL